MGTGLGLYSCFRICSKIGPNENIKITSEINLGSEFSFYIYYNLN